MLFLMVVACCISAGEGRDWTEGMFPHYLAAEDLRRLPDQDGCRVVHCPVNGLMVYGQQCRVVPSYPEGVDGERKLAVLGTGIRALVAGDFTTWGQLTSLRIEINVELLVIEPRVFYHLTSLTNLSISNNYNLQSIDSEVFDGLLNLKELRFIKNNLKSLFDFSLAARPFVLPSLLYLDLSENPIQRIAKSDFAEMDGSPLQALKLELCGLYSIDPESFNRLTNLSTLDLGRNNLNSQVIMDLLVSLNSSSSSLKYLGLSSNLLSQHFNNLLQVIARTNIAFLDLRSNHFDYLPSNFFPTMPNLQILDLREVSAFDIEEGTFSYSLLPNLKYLYLSGNRLQGFIRALKIPHILELDISNNNCLTCPTYALFNIPEYSLQSLKSITVLNLSRNHVYHISKYMFFGVKSLRALYLSNCSVFSISDYAFSNLTNLEHLDLSKNHFPFNNGLKPLAFHGLTSLSSLRLDSCSITSLNRSLFIYLVNLKYLTLAENSLLEIDPMVLMPLTLLRRLDLSYNEILPWKIRIFERNSNLQYLSVAANHLFKLTSEMLFDFQNIQVLILRDNPLKCNCELARLIHSADKQPENLFGLNDSAVKCIAPDEWAERRALEFIEHSDSFDCLDWNLIIIIICAVSLVTVVLCSVLVYYMRWYLRYWMFLLKQAWRASFPRKRPDRANMGKYKYDAFVSYCNEDRNFVVRMVSMMENYEPYFKLCVFERDFNAGEVICESVVDCLAVSKKTILILTDAFARSQWCQWELQMAHHKRFFFKSESQDSLILIKLGDIMEAHMTPTLRYLMKTRIYLQWYTDPRRQKIFWQKLREALSSRGNSTINI